MGRERKMIHALKIGEIVYKNNLFVAPLAGYTDFAFRKLCYQFGAGLCFTEMVSSKGLVYGSEKTEELLHLDETETVTATQIFGSDPYIMRQACESAALQKFRHIDINMGCPVPKLYKNGEGSALLNNFPLAEKIIKECKKSGKVITVKFRVGLEEDKLLATEFAKLCEGAGADSITIHGRVRSNGHTGKVDYKQIASAKKAVQIPVIANGGIQNRQDALKTLQETGADGIMVARGAMENPHICSEILYDSPPTAWKKKESILQQLSDMQKFYSDKFIIVQMRKMIAFYSKGMPNSSIYRKQLFSCNSIVELEKCITQIFTV